MSDDVQEKIHRGQRARFLLDDPILNEAFDSMIAEANQIADNSKPTEVELREQCYRAKKAIEALRKRLAYWVSDAAIEQKQLDLEQEKLKEKDNVA